MKILVRCFALLVIGVSLSAQPQAPSQPPSAPAAAFVQLFDGTTLNHWTVDDSQYANNFSVRDGVLRIEGVGGWLRSARQYSDYTLRFEFRYLTEDPGGRSGVSGVFLRVPASAAYTYGNGWPRGVEVQLSNRSGARTAAPGDPRWGGAIVYHEVPGGPISFDTHTALRTYGETGEWQTHEIQVIGNFATVLLNDRFLARGYLGGDAAGHIGLQAESGTIEFRSIQIKEGAGPVPPRTTEGFVSIFDGKTLDGWTPANPASKTFSVQNGAIHVDGRQAFGLRNVAPPTQPGAPPAPGCMGNLFTDKAYGDFTLRFEAKFDSGLADSGFLTRVPADGGAYQIQLQGMGETELPWNGLMFRQGTVPQGETTFDYYAASKAYSKVGDWTTYEVQAYGQAMTIKVNGIVVGRADNVGVPTGKFGFQCEVNSVELRNIMVREGLE